MSLKPNKDLLLKVIKFAVAFGLIALMVKQELLDFSVLMEMATPLNLAVALTLALCNLAFATYRWTLLLQARHFEVSMKETFPLSLIGTFFNFAIPGA
ncbi:MAG: flippase-like domain-containing protein, partial [Bdellovibrionales bacterium]|nr:flippase-like domain-containing protein [Bdellovibrionales bacterium]